MIKIEDLERIKNELSTILCELETQKEVVIVPNNLSLKNEKIEDLCQDLGNTFQRLYNLIIVEKRLENKEM